MDIDENPSKKPSSKSDDLAEYNLDDYDEDESKATGEHEPMIVHLKLLILSLTEVGPFSNIKGLTYYRDNEEDPYITLKEVFDCLNLIPSQFIHMRFHRMKTTTNVKNFKFFLPIIFLSLPKQKTRFLN